MVEHYAVDLYTALSVFIFDEIENNKPITHEGCTTKFSFGLPDE